VTAQPDFPGARYLRRPQDPDLQQRWEKLRRLGIGENADREFDEVAKNLAHATGAPYAMVNFLSDRQQYFAGLYPASDVSTSAAAAILRAESVGRTMPLDHGFCPYVVERRLAYPLEDICDYPRFIGNPVIAKLNVRSYLGAPLIDPRTNTVLGTVCVVVPHEPRSWGQEGVDLIKATAADVVERINRRDEQRTRYPN
jgi:GAF domain-containing protein